MRKRPPAVILLRVPKGCSTAPRPHPLRGGARIHAGDGVLVQMAGDDATRGRGAARLQRAAGAVRGRVDDGALLAVQLLAHEPAAGRAGEAVACGVVGEGGAVEQRAIAVIVDGALGRHAGDDAVALAGGGMGAVVEALAPDPCR